MEKSFFFNAVVNGGVPDRVYDADDIAERDACIISNGVLGGASLKVMGISLSSVVLEAGAACIDGYTYLNTQDLYLPVEAGDRTYGRIDTVALKLDRDARAINAVVVKGTPSAEPTPPVLMNTGTVTYLPLAEVSVAAGSPHAVESGDITDRRVLAGYASVKEDLLMVIREYLGEIDPINASEMFKLRRIIGIVSEYKGKDTVLCGDGVYRSMPTVKREIATEYDLPGKDVFIPSEFPSEDGYYDIEVQGGGGAGGSYNGITHRGGGGGGGAYLAVNRVKLDRDQYTVVVGGGGVGVLGGDGGDGEASAFDGFMAEGGLGGGGGVSSAGGKGGVGMYRGRDGYDGDPMDGSEIYTYCGRGGYSKYGDGAFSTPGAVAADGNDAEVTGAGGSGASSNIGAFDKKGGRGGDGKVTVYRYVTLGTEDA